MSRVRVKANAPPLSYYSIILFENLNNTQRNYTLAYGSYTFKRPWYKDLIIRGFTVYSTQVGVEQNYDVYYYG